MLYGVYVVARICGWRVVIKIPRTVVVLLDINFYAPLLNRPRPFFVMVRVLLEHLVRRPSGGL